MPLSDPSSLPGTHRSRVFIGGSYSNDLRPLLDDLAATATGLGFCPIVADEYQLLIPDHDIHDVTLSLLHSCRLAVFELSRVSGAIMEVERTSDYGIRCLVLYGSQTGKMHLPSRMVSSFVSERNPQVQLASYVRPQRAVRQARLWLQAMRRMVYAQHA